MSYVQLLLIFFPANLSLSAQQILLLILNCRLNPILNVINIRILANLEVGQFAD